MADELFDTKSAPQAEKKADPAVAKKPETTPKTEAKKADAPKKDDPAPKPETAKKDAPASKPAADTPDIGGGGNAHSIAASQLRSYIERVERLEEEKSTISEDIKEVKTEVKAAGFDIKTFNEMLKLRKLDATEREEREALRDLYGHALGIFG